jgi:hypothetical protein
VYDVNSVEQGTPEPVTIEMEKDDYLIVWDEDPGHGGNQHFNYTGTLTAVADPNAEPMQVSSNDETIINWVVRKAYTPVTLTITDTSENEHDIVHLQRNWLELNKEVVSINDSNDFSCVEPYDTVTYEICWDNNSIFTFEDCYLVDYLPEEVFYPGSKWTLSIRAVNGRWIRIGSRFLRTLLMTLTRIPISIWIWVRFIRTMQTASN